MHMTKGGGAISSSVPREKKIYLEALRIVALFWVLYNHTGSYGWLLFREWSSFLSDAPSKLWLCINVILFVFCKISVSLFLMISGAVLLGKDEPISTLLRKRVSRFIILIVAVTAARGFFLHHIGHSSMQDILTLWDFLRKAWSSTDICTYYLFLYLGFLFALPLLRIIAQKRNLIRYNIYVYILFQELLPVFQSALNLENSNIYPYIGIFSMYYVLLLLGYYIDTLPDSFFSKKNCTIVSFAVCGMLLFSVGIAYWYSSVKNVIMPWLTCLVPTGMMYLFKYVYMSSSVSNKLVSRAILRVAPLVFGAFLLSGDIQWAVFPVYQHLILWMPAQLASLIWVLLIFAVSLCGCALLRCIPGVKKLI